MEQIALLQQLFFWSALVYWISGFFLLWRIPSAAQKNWLIEGNEKKEEKKDHRSFQSAYKADQSHTPVCEMSIVIPARNEAVNIGTLLSSIAAQHILPLEVIVVDDQSEDGTSEIVEKYAGTMAGTDVRLIKAGDRPEGWTGKNWSCHCGASQAKGRLVLFLDADTRFESPNALLLLSEHHARLGGMVSVQPYHRVQKFYEQMSGFFNLIVMVGSGAFDRWSKAGEADGCFGPCILMDRTEYEAVGGHEAVKDQVVDDLALCALYRGHGLGVHCFGGRELISFRMYPGGLRSLIEGWTKNMAVGASLAKVRNIVMLVIWFTGISNAALALSTWISAGFGSALNQSVLWTFLVGGVYALYVLQVYVQLRRVGNFTFLTALLFPLEFLFFVAIFVYSIIRTSVIGSVSWKGRSIQTGRE